MDRNPLSYLSKLQIHGRTRDSILFHRKRFQSLKSLFHRDLIAHYGCVNALEFSNDCGNFLASGGDDKRILLWNVNSAMLKPNYRPVQMNATHLSNIFCLSFNKSDKNVMSSGNDGRIIIHDLQTSKLVDVYMCDSSVYGLSASPVDDNLVAAACEDGNVFIMDTRLSRTEGMCLSRRLSAFHSVMYSPVDHHLLVTSHSRDGVGLWDIRSPRTEVLHYGNRSSKQRAMSARFNSTGNQILCLRRRQPIVLFNISDTENFVEFKSDGYSNSCTMKSCCFAGDKDQYVVSGSDDFGVYIWKIPEYQKDGSVVVDNAVKILKGHRSIVNQVRFNKHSNILVSCGVEKMLKLWSTEQLPHAPGIDADSCERPRKKYSHSEYIRLIFESTGMIHDYHTENTREDPKMLAFFDSLVQHEAEEGDSDSCNSDQEITIAQRNHYFATEGGETEITSNDESEPIDEGPASLEMLGIGATSGDAAELPDAALRRLRRLRDIIRVRDAEEPNWRVRDITSQQSTTVQEEPIRKVPKTKRRKKDSGCSSKETSDSSDSDDEAARTRQRNARRRLRVKSETQVLSTTSDDGTPSTSGILSSSSSKSDAEACIGTSTSSNNNDHNGTRAESSLL